MRSFSLFAGRNCLGAGSVEHLDEAEEHLESLRGETVETAESAASAAAGSRRPAGDCQSHEQRSS